MTFVSTEPAEMSSAMLLDPIPSPDSESSSTAPRFRPYSSPNHHVTKGRYITSNDPRGYIPVYEYPLNGQWIMLDMDDGYVLWTGIWKALGNSKADIVKMIESQPDLASKLRRVRGGYLKIQGTWMPYEIALRLARRVAWPIRHELVPLFGPTFPTTCLSPDQPGYGQVVKPAPGKRRTRRHREAARADAVSQDWTIISPATAPVESAVPQVDHLVQLYMPYAQAYPTPMSTSPSTPLDALTSKLPNLSCSGSASRYSPYPSPLSSHPLQFSSHSPPLLGQRRGSGSSGFSEEIRLPPILAPDNSSSDRRKSISLPPISALDSVRRGQCDDSAAVLKRLQSTDDNASVSPATGSPSRTGYHAGPPQLPHASSLSYSAGYSTPFHSYPPSGRPVSPSSPYLTPSSQHSAGSMNDLAMNRLPTPPSSRSSLEDANAYLRPRFTEASVKEPDARSAAKSSNYDVQSTSSDRSALEGRLYLTEARPTERLASTTHTWRPW
ncbi:hypothetical protein NM688_g6091 [Phlebia brevispora]|uniref:Uncharacterized protein n=1 Tax=Phlebia brevispora TaxID=194682 RepID=A0ACC1SK12_9APHY|nr:hypothetical protein NM688_g6091 [Phlebia brevispora]